VSRVLRQAGRRREAGLIDGVSLHNEPQNRSKDQKGRYIDRENLKCPHGLFCEGETSDCAYSAALVG